MAELRAGQLLRLSGNRRLGKQVRIRLLEILSQMGLSVAGDRIPDRDFKTVVVYDKRSLPLGRVLDWELDRATA